MKNEANEKAVRQIVEDMRQAWNRGDGEGWAAHFSEDADAISWNGKYVNGRSQNAAIHTYLFREVYPGTTNHLAIRSIRWLGERTAVVLTETHLTNAQGEQVGFKTVPLLVMHKAEDLWQVVTFQNTAVSE